MIELLLKKFALLVPVSGTRPLGHRLEHLGDDQAVSGRLNGQICRFLSCGHCPSSRPGDKARRCLPARGPRPALEMVPECCENELVVLMRDDSSASALIKPAVIPASGMIQFRSLDLRFERAGPDIFLIVRQVAQELCRVVACFMRIVDGLWSWSWRGRSLAEALRAVNRLSPCCGGGNKKH